MSCPSLELAFSMLTFIQILKIENAAEIHVEEPSAASNGPAAERPKAGRKPRASKKGTSNSAEEATSSAAAEPSEAPKKILKNPAALPVKTVEEEEVPVHTKVKILLGRISF